MMNFLRWCHSNKTPIIVDFVLVFSYALLAFFYLALLMVLVASGSYLWPVLFPGVPLGILFLAYQLRDRNKNQQYEDDYDDEN